MRDSSNTSVGAA
uniref:Uncharacterized protein n=1 Tax=Anopheles quadriannulatus TaxID=34691 RepID=A0A182XSH7_ANOQN